MDALARFRQTCGIARQTETPDVRSLIPCRVLVALLAWLVPLAVLAAPGAYTGEAPVNSQSDEDRAAALKIALANVVVAQSGDSGAPGRPDVAKAIEQAERYVLQYQYRRGGDASKFVLVAQFDSTAVDKLLRRNGGTGAEAEAVDAPAEATVWIGGINDANDYARVIAYLARNNFVRNAQPIEARGDGVLVRLSLSSGLARFVEAAEMERVLGAKAGARVDGADAALALTP